MKKILWSSLLVLILHASVHAADKIRIAIPSLAAHFVTFPLAQKKGFLKEEGLEAEMIRVFGTVAIAALTNGEIDYFTAMKDTKSTKKRRLERKERGSINSWFDRLTILTHSTGLRVMLREIEV